MSKIDTLKLNIRANMVRINELLELQGIEEQFKHEGWYGINKENVELRQRMKILRKDTINFEKAMKGSKLNEKSIQGLYMVK